jgi:hypothetical protein
MARYFSNPNADALTIGSVITGGTNGKPFTVAGWMNVISLSVGAAIMGGVRQQATPGGTFEMAYADNGNSKATAGAWDGTTFQAATPTSTITLGTTSNPVWQFYAGVFVSPSSRTVYFGAPSAAIASGSQSLTSTPTGLTLTEIGLANAVIACVGFWKVALSATDVGQLYNNGRGCSPRKVRPDQLVGYARLSGPVPTGGAKEPDLIQAGGWTVNGTTSSQVDAYPPVFFP